MGIIKSCIILISKVAMCTSQSCTSLPLPHRLFNVQGINGKMNDIIYNPAMRDKPSSLVIYFGGDMQDYLENMMSHRDNKAYAKWNLESTAQLLHEKFPSSAILVIKPMRMHLKTFSCYSNFVDTNDFGVPDHEVSIDALKHLNLLVQNAVKRISELSCSKNSAKNECLNSCSTQILDESLTLQASLPIFLIGFSKGCVVLNQLLHSLKALSEEVDTTQASELKTFVERIKIIYWLDGGHPGSSSTWITDKSILQNYCQFQIKTRIHVTPYQVLCAMRPRLGKEEKIFRETLKRLDNDVKRTLHFEDRVQSPEMHFQVLIEFDSSE